MGTKRKFIHILSFLLLLCLLLGTSAVVGAAASTREGELITTRNDFINALNQAKDGDTLLVGDIDFNLNHTGAVNTAERIVIGKNITIKSGKTDGNVVFTGASLILNGTKIGGERSAFVFEAIISDEGLDTSTLTDEDWQLSYDSLDELISLYPLKNQYAIECKGNTKATFEDCDFKNYMHTYGPAIRAFYGDYTLSPSLEAEHGDNAPYKLEINLENCDFSSNASLYGGGAIYIQAVDKNVTLNADGCSFTENKSGFTYHSVGGGAICAQSAVVNLTDCSFTENEANYFYGEDRETTDELSGGAVYIDLNAELMMRNCKVAGNKASKGGGIAVTSNSTAIIEDCVFIENKAIPEAADKQSMYGLASNQGLGGGIYLNGAINVTIGNTEIRHNYAKNAMGAIFTYYDLLNDYSTYSVELLFCTIAGNTCGTKMTDYIGYGEDAWLWFSYYTDFFDISYLEYYGNLVVDEIYETYCPKSEQPTEVNGYNYFGSTAPAQWYNDEGHLVHAPTLSTEIIKEKLGERNYYGTFTVGANSHDVTFKFFMDDVCVETITLPSGEHPTRPALEKTGYTLTAWTLAEDLDYHADRYFIVGNKTESVDFHAVFTPNVYKVTFDFGNAQTVEVQQTFDSHLAFPEQIERSGYKFGGWFTEKDGQGTQLTDGGVFNTGGEITYYAFYEKSFPLATVFIITFGVLFAGGLAALAFVVFKHKKQTVLVMGEPVVTAEKEAPDTSMLTPREKEVLELLLEGKQRNEIAAMLYISENTVKKQITSIYQKLGVSSRNELFALFK